MDPKFEQTGKPDPISYLEAIPLDRAEISTACLNIENKERSNLFPWNGQFSPQFVEALLARYADRETRILDPFCGSGTVLSEAARLGLAATGIEVNPAAYILSKIYSFCNVLSEVRQVTLDAVENELQGILPKGWPLFAAEGAKPAVIYQQELVALCNRSTNDQKPVIEALIILVDFFKGIDASKITKTWGKLRQVIEDLPYNPNSINVQHGDGRFPDAIASFDLVVTSPPYINVYNYHQQYRASAEALGWDLLEVARTEIGSNRKHRGNRFLTVTQYCLDLTLALHSLWASTSQNARLIFVLGRESRVRGVQFLNGEIAARLAVDAVGYQLLMRQERVFTNRFGQHIYEDILHLAKGQGPLTGSQERARIIANLVLRQAMINVSDLAIQTDLLDAIEKVYSVSQSPRFIPKTTHTSQNMAINNDLSDTTSRKTKRHSCKRKATGER